MTYTEQLATLAESNPQLGMQVSTLRNLEAILKWATETEIPFDQIDLVQQDEYSYDLYLPLPLEQWLVFGVS